MNKVAHYLQEHVVGEVMTSSDARQYFSTDNSIFSVTPSVIVYPKNANDVRKTARFAWQLAERGKTIPLTARGSGTDLSGAAIGSGVLLIFPAHLNHVQSFDPKEGFITVDAGINFGKLQQTLLTHQRFIPPAPSSYEYSTVGGAVANNTSSMRSLKYGDMRGYVRGLKVVLANGEIINTERLNKKELNRKLGLTTFEGEIYRSIDALIEENKEIINNNLPQVTKNVSGYDLADIKLKDGSFDLTPLFVGSQGTLGLITEITLATEIKSLQTTLVTTYLDSAEDVQSVVMELRALEELPAAIELVDANLLDYVDLVNPNYLKEVIKAPFPKFILLIEINCDKEHKQKKELKRITKILAKYTKNSVIEEDMDKQNILWKIREASALLTAHNQGLLKPIPLIDDGIVPIDKLATFITNIYDQFTKEHLDVSIWGSAGDANLHIQPYLNLGQVGDRQKAFRMLEEFSSSIRDLGGQLTGQYNDGRLRGPYLSKLYSDEIFQCFKKVKQIFDPYNILNPGIKVDVSLDEIKHLLRSDYSLKHVYDHIPLT